VRLKNEKRLAWVTCCGFRCRRITVCRGCATPQKYKKPNQINHLASPLSNSIQSHLQFASINRCNSCNLRWYFGVLWLDLVKDRTTALVRSPQQTSGFLKQSACQRRTGTVIDCMYVETRTKPPDIRHAKPPFHRQTPATRPPRCRIDTGQPGLRRACHFVHTD
jgi:hypothetical protein